MGISPFKERKLNCAGVIREVDILEVVNQVNCNENLQEFIIDQFRF